MKLLEISIDHKLMPIEYVFPFYQKVPFPGNHRYFLDVHFDSKKALDKVIKRHGLNDFEKVDWAIFFLYLSSLWQSDENIKAKYLINNVTGVSFNQISLRVEGLCSDVLGS